MKKRISDRARRLENGEKDRRSLLSREGKKLGKLTASTETIIPQKEKRKRMWVRSNERAKPQSCRTGRGGGHVRNG